MKKALVLATSLLVAAPMVALAGPVAGEKSFTISGTGASDKDFDGNAFGVSAELGYYHNEQVLYGVRQSFNGLAGDKVNDEWNGSTRGFVDYHFGTGDLRPYIGANLGMVYGESVKDTGSAGIDLGLKYYVLDKTYISFGAEYQFLFDDGDDIDNRFGNGAFYYTLGVGFNF